MADQTRDTVSDEIESNEQEQEPIAVNRSTIYA
jgi:hypothetical protein